MQNQIYLDDVVCSVLVVLSKCFLVVFWEA